MALMNLTAESGFTIPLATEGVSMARRTIFVSDLSGKEIDERDAVRVTVSYTDARRGQVVVDAHPDDAEVKRLVEVGTKQARRGRKPKAG